MTCPKIPTQIKIFFNPNNQIEMLIMEGITSMPMDGKIVDFCKGKSPDEILALDFQQLAKTLMIEKEEDVFFLFTKFEALRCALAAYIGDQRTDVETERCIIEEIHHTHEGSTMSAIILPPQSFPKIS